MRVRAPINSLPSIFFLASARHRAQRTAQHTCTHAHKTSVGCFYNLSARLLDVRENTLAQQQQQTVCFTCLEGEGAKITCAGVRARAPAKNEGSWRGDRETTTGAMRRAGCAPRHMARRLKTQAQQRQRQRQKKAVRCAPEREKVQEGRAAGVGGGGRAHS